MNLKKFKIHKIRILDLWSAASYCEQRLIYSIELIISVEILCGIRRDFTPETIPKRQRRC